MKNQPLHKFTEAHPLSVTDAITRTTNWRLWCVNQNIGEGDILRSFHIGLGDLKALVDLANSSAIHNMSGVRAYIAMSAENNLDTLELILVPTIPTTNIHDDRDTDVFIPLVSPPPGEPVEPSALFNVYDLVTPCPNLCGRSSPLYDENNPIPLPEPNS